MVLWLMYYEIGAFVSNDRPVLLGLHSKNVTPLVNWDRLDNELHVSRDFRSIVTL